MYSVHVGHEGKFMLMFHHHRTEYMIFGGRICVVVRLRRSGLLLFFVTYSSQSAAVTSGIIRFPMVSCNLHTYTYTITYIYILTTSRMGYGPVFLRWEPHKLMMRGEWGVGSRTGCFHLAGGVGAGENVPIYRYGVAFFLCKNSLPISSLVIVADRERKVTVIEQGASAFQRFPGHVSLIESQRDLYFRYCQL